MKFVTIYPEPRTMITALASPNKIYPIKLEFGASTVAVLTKQEARALALDLLKLTGEACPTLRSNGGYSAIVDDACGDQHHAEGR